MFCMPVVTETDFEALKTIMSPPLPATYEGWLTLCSKWTSEHGEEGVVQFRVNRLQFALREFFGVRRRDPAALVATTRRP